MTTGQETTKRGLLWTEDKVQSVRKVYDFLVKNKEYSFMVHG